MAPRIAAQFRPAQKGLSQFDAPPGSLLAFAISPGNAASDGRGKHGPYTENLLRELSVRDTRIEDALKRTHAKHGIAFANMGMNVVRRERIKVPAGEFDAFRSKDAAGSSRGIARSASISGWCRG